MNKEILEKLEKIYYQVGDSCRKAMEKEFPELAESEDERIRKDLIEALKQLDREKCPVDSYPYLEWATWLEKQKVQQTAEWSDEDEKIWKDIFELCNRFGYDDACRKLKSLRPQSNEEYKEKVRQIKTQIALCNGFNRENRDKIFVLLDSLYPQPHWKPSEEQEALENMPRWKKATSNASNGAWICLSHKEMNYPHYTNFLEIGDYYLRFEDLEKLPKEE